MPDIVVICVGKIKERFFTDACNEYSKRLSAFCNFSFVEIAEQIIKGNISDNAISNALSIEAGQIRKYIPKDAYVITMCIEGEKLSSEGLASRFRKIMLEGKSKICFIIGGSYGLDQNLKRDSDFRLSMSDMTFPHHLARVMVSEQIYRAFSILEGSKYHK